MHEATIARSILNIVEKRIESLGPYARALRVEILCGEFRNVDPESLGFAFDSMKECSDSTADCRLDINLIKATARCTNQHIYQPIGELAYRCPHCDGGIEKMLQGEELDVVNVVVEVEKGEQQHARVT